MKRDDEQSERESSIQREAIYMCKINERLLSTIYKNISIMITRTLDKQFLYTHKSTKSKCSTNIQRCAQRHWSSGKCKLNHSKIPLYPTRWLIGGGWRGKEMNDIMKCW